MMDDFTILFDTFNGGPEWSPVRVSDDSEGYDIRARVDGIPVTHPVEPPTIQPGFPPLSSVMREWPRMLISAHETVLVPTGVFVRRTWPEGIACLLLPRSSISKTTLIVQNSPGLIDRMYIGREIFVAMHNVGKKPVIVYHGERIAQLLFVQCAPLVVKCSGLLPTDKPDYTSRPGRGSSGKF